MSRFASIDIVVSSPSKTSVDIIKALLKAGWTFNDYDNVSYLPIGDNDDFDWQRKPASDIDLVKLFTEKDKLGEIIGVVMTWKKTNVGGEMIFRQDNSFSFSLSMNRKNLAQHSNVTDINWYLERLIPAISINEMVVESIKFDEHI